MGFPRLIISMNSMIIRMGRGTFSGYSPDGQEHKKAKDHQPFEIHQQASLLSNSYDLGHACFHVVEQVAMECPVALFYRRDQNGKHLSRFG
jgi:hypothetical protein